MNAYRVENMTCGHCARTVEKTIHALQETAEVDVDLATGIVRIGCDDALAPMMASAMTQAGYPTSLVNVDRGVAPVVAAARRRCCCS